jgi:hypothetical protein
MAVFAIDQGAPVRCECAADAAVIEVLGAGRYEATFSGFMEVTPEEELVLEDRAVIPLRITGHETVGMGDGVGTIQVSHDFDRVAPLSELRQLSAESAFPAAQTMRVNILVRLGVLPGVTLRNIELGNLVNDGQLEFPPQDAYYDLQGPMDLEDVANPGVVVARILSYRAHINPAGGSTDHHL